jgi:GNAT superfamily N-acetyltransferase
VIKYASLEILSFEYGDDGPIRRQAHRADFRYDPRPGFLYVRSRAISSRCNDNYDDFPASEIIKGYRSFLGKPVFVNHVNDDHRRARGVVIDAALHHDVNPNGTPDVWCEVLMEVDAHRFPKLAQAIVLGHIDKTSMGVDVEYSICSACGNKATNPAEYCRHIPQMKGSKIVRRNAKTGRPEEHLIFETCYGLSFFENSLLVEDPADPTAYFLGVDTRGLHRTAAARWRYDERDTKQQRAILRSNRSAQKARELFPPGTRVKPRPSKDEEPTARGTVNRHVPGSDAQGGTLVIDWDSGVTGRHGPISILRDDAPPPKTGLRAFASSDEEGPRTGEFGDEHVMVHVHQFKPGQYYLRNLSVHPNYRGEGIGRRFMKSITDEHDRNGSKLVLHTAQPGLVDWYKTMGFKPTEYDDFFKAQRMEREPQKPMQSSVTSGLLRFIAVAEEENDDLSSLSPMEIDQRLGDHHDKLSTHLGRQHSALREMHYAVGDSESGRGRSKSWRKTHAEVLGTDTTGMNPRRARDYERARNAYDSAGQDASTEMGHIGRHEDEFRKRGGWSRFFLVPDGHIHSSMQCHSCHPTTQFSWLPHLSGKTEGEAVEAHGPHLCTHCFKSAPTEWKRNPAETRAEEKKQSGEYCEGGKASSYPDSEERQRRAAEHPKGLIRLDPGEAMFSPRKRSYVGRCPTCKTMQKVKNDGEFYQHKPPEPTEEKPQPKPEPPATTVMTPPREEPKPAAPAPGPSDFGPHTVPQLPHPDEKKVKSHLRKDHGLPYAGIKNIETRKTLMDAHEDMHANPNSWVINGHTHPEAKEGSRKGLSGFAAGGGGDGWGH